MSRLPGALWLLVPLLYSKINLNKLKRAYWTLKLYWKEEKNTIIKRLSINFIKISSTFTINTPRATKSLKKKNKIAYNLKSSLLTLYMNIIKTLFKTWKRNTKSLLITNSWCYLLRKNHIILKHPLKLSFLNENPKQ